MRNGIVLAGNCLQHRSSTEAVIVQTQCLAIRHIDPMSKVVGGQQQSTAGNVADFVHRTVAMNSVHYVMRKSGQYWPTMAIGGVHKEQTYQGHDSQPILAMRRVVKGRRHTPDWHRTNERKEDDRRGRMNKSMK